MRGALRLYAPVLEQAIRLRYVDRGPRQLCWSW